MKMSPLVNRPNIAHREAVFVHENYTLHSWCEDFEVKSRKNSTRPLLIRIDNGPIQCRSCGRRVSKRLRKVLLNNCAEARFHDRLGETSRSKKVTLTYYSLDRKDLDEEGLKGWHLHTRLLQELT